MIRIPRVRHEFFFFFRKFVTLVSLKSPVGTAAPVHYLGPLPGLCDGERGRRRLLQGVQPHHGHQQHRGLQVMDVCVCLPVPDGTFTSLRARTNSGLITQWNRSLEYRVNVSSFFFPPQFVTLVSLKVPSGWCHAAWAYHPSLMSLSRPCFSPTNVGITRATPKTTPLVVISDGGRNFGLR